MTPVEDGAVEHGRQQDRIAPRGVLLPGVAGICLFMLLLALLNTFAALRGVFSGGWGRYGVLALCTLLVVGIFGLLRMLRWGWAIVTAGAILMSIGDLYIFERSHVGFFAVRSMFGLVFFLYLVRADVRERLR